MPDMDGLECAAMIRQRERSRDTPIIFLTAYRSDEQVYKGYYLGAVDYLQKPIVPEVLRSKVSVFVELKRKNDLLRQKNIELQHTIAERLKAEDAVRRLNAELEQRVMLRTQELSRSNDELRQFAYVASHDLQEPLRTVGSYAQLLAKRYDGKLGEDADDFIRYIVDGVYRMHVLLNDMLAYSRVTDTNGRPMAPSDCEMILKTAIMNLEASIKENEAEITHAPLPTLVADDVQLTQLFQNLIGNAIKYRSADAPRIHISATEDGRQWRFAIHDNGIGIEEQYKEQVFGLFKRLHSQREYEGTSIGLAICQKIIQRYQGRIWVESCPGEGSTFFFTVPR